MIKMTVFDMAGTTIDENNVVYKILQKAINEAGHSFTLEQVLTEGAGKEKRQAIEDILKMGEVPRNEAFARQVYEKFIAQLAIAYDIMDITGQPGASELFDKLKSKGIKVVLNTGYNQATAEKILKKVGWTIGEQVDALVTASHVPRNRPMPDMIQHAMRQFGLEDAKEVVKVGDSIIDIEEGRNAGCGLTIGITTGAHTREQLLTANPDHVVDHLSEVMKFL